MAGTDLTELMLQGGGGSFTKATDPIQQEAPVRSRSQQLVGGVLRGLASVPLLPFEVMEFFAPTPESKQLATLGKTTIEEFLNVPPPPETLEGKIAEAVYLP